MREEGLTETIEYKGYKIKIYLDPDPEDPREWDNLGTMLCKHNRYSLGDKLTESGAKVENMEAKDISEYVKKKDVISLALFLYDHSGLTLRSSRDGSNPFYGKLPQGHAEFDSGLVGWITISKDKAKREMERKKFSKKLTEKILRALESEVETYNNYLQGSVYGYMIVRDEEEELDGCWGFYPDSSPKRGQHELEYMLSECRSIIDHYTKKDDEKKNIQENVTAA